MLQEWGNTENILEQPQLDPHMEYKNRPGTKKIEDEEKEFATGTEAVYHSLKKRKK